MKYTKAILVPMFALAAFQGLSEADAVTVTHEAINTPVDNIIGVTDFQTLGNDMAGMTVTAKFANGTSDTETWNATSSTAGAVLGQGWKLVESGDTFSSNWNLTITTSGVKISSLTLTGFSADNPSDLVVKGTTFDRTSPDPGTKNSAQGHDLSVSSATGGWNAIDVTYSDPLAVSGKSALFDEYRQMQLVFGTLNGNVLTPTPFVFGNSLSFVQDTDTVGTPEPSSFLLAAMGLLLVTTIGRRTVRRPDERPKFE